MYSFSYIGEKCFSKFHYPPLCLYPRALVPFEEATAFSDQMRFKGDFFQQWETNTEKESKHSLSNSPKTCVLGHLNSHSLTSWVSQMSLLGAQPFHTPTNNFTFSTLKTRFNKPFSFHRQTLWKRRMDSQFRFYSLFICKEDLISSLLSTHKVRVTMGTQSAPLFSMALRLVPLWGETTAVFTFGRQTGSLRAAMFVFVPDT